MTTGKPTFHRVRVKEEEDMDVYELSVDLRPGVRDTEFVAEQSPYRLHAM